MVFIPNILQAVFTELNADEAYYFLYGRHLAWGYFDHPPMIAVMVRISSLLFHGNLGVRFMTVLLQAFLPLRLFGKQLDKKENGDGPVILFFVIAFSFVMFNVYGFITTPDAPLLFFTALFLYAYKKFSLHRKLDRGLVAVCSDGRPGVQ